MLLEYEKKLVKVITVLEHFLSDSKNNEIFIKLQVTTNKSKA